MPGLLSPDEQSQINNDALMGLGMGLLSASGPSRVPVSMGQAMGMGMQGMMQGKSQAELMAMKRKHMEQEAQQNAMLNEMNQMKLAAMRNDQQSQEQAKQNLIKYLGEMPDGQQKEQIKSAMMMGVPMSKVWEKVNPDPYTLSPGSIRYGSDNQQIASAPVERKAPEGMQYDTGGNLVEIPGYVSMKSKIAAAGRAPASVTPFYQFLPTSNGYAVGNARDGSIAPAMLGGAPVVRASDDPNLQGRIAQSKESGKVYGEETTKAQIGLPGAIAKGEEALRLVGELRKHPGMSQAVGKSSMLGIQKIPGTDAYDFMNRLGQVKSGAFMTAFETLKGGGQITEVEGAKATAALARMDNATSEHEFNQALTDYESVIRRAVGTSKLRAGNKPAQPAGAKFLGFE